MLKSISVWLSSNDNLQWLVLWFLMFNMGRVLRKFKNLEGKK